MKKIYNLQNIDFLEIEKSLKTGELIIYPTDTVYGIGGVISSEETIKNILLILFPLIIINFHFKL